MRLSNFDAVSSIIEEISRQKEQILHDSLNDLIGTGLIVVEQTVPVVVQDPMSAKYVFRQSFRLVLKDKEHIAALEQENKELKDKLAQIASAIAGMETK